jgi:hypothetical protein
MVRYTLSVLMSIIYGQRAATYDDPMGSIIIEALAKLNLAINHGASLPLDLVPILQYIPEPFAWWKTATREIRNLEHAFMYGMLAGTEKRAERGESNDSFMDGIIAKQEQLGMTRELIA